MKSRMIQTPLGAMRLAEAGGRLFSAVFTQGHTESEWVDSPLLDEADKQIREYFTARRQAFELPIELSGTEFEMSVYRALLEIPYGQTRTYGQLAALLERPGAARAVGQACRKNPLHIFVPCHRVIGSQEKLTGFAAGIEKKKALLTLERPQEF